jgi:16S rRNA (guanine527-N7)-methyltransferase
LAAKSTALPDLTADRARALALTPVSRETAQRLDRFVGLLLTWQNATNLIAPSTIPHIWTRHVADSLQLLDLADGGQTWVDLGTGAGFPGLVLACAFPEGSGQTVHLVESNGKKAAFLREAIRVTGAAAVVHPVRIEDFVDSFDRHADVVTARALASLRLLIDFSARLLTTDSVGLFPKGQDAVSELTNATKYWNMQATLVPSRTDPKARIVVVRAPVQQRM